MSVLVSEWSPSVSARQLHQNLGCRHRELLKCIWILNTNKSFTFWEKNLQVLCQFIARSITLRNGCLHFAKRKARRSWEAASAAEHVVHSYTQSKTCCKLELQLGMRLDILWTTLHGDRENGPRRCTLRNSNCPQKTAQTGVVSVSTEWDPYLKTSAWLLAYAL